MNEAINQRELDLALERYSILMSYLQYENTTYWTRAGFIMVAHAVFFAGIAQNIASTGPEPTRSMVLIGIVISAAGLILSWIFWKTL